MRRSTFIALAALAAITACSDTSAPPPVGPLSPTRLSPSTTPTELDLEIGTVIVALFPNGLETAAGTRWSNVKRKLSENDRATAISMFNELTTWILGKERQLDAMPSGETKTHATARLVAMMAAYVYGGESAIPLDATSGDVAFGQVLPGVASVIVTPLKRAGVSFDIGSVLEPTLVVISQNLTPYEHCKGPLETSLCQYPTFYKFEPYPYRRLEKPARFGVCHVNSGPFAPPEGIHDRFRLAHTKPADPANYSPNAIRPEGENIEILPLVHVGFLECENTSYGALTPEQSSLRERHWYDRGLLALGYALDAAGNFLTPKNAYAIDLGGGGEGWGFSDFNVVDPQSNLIDFERFSDGEPTSPTCDDGGCKVMNEYGNDGVIFEFRRFVIEGQPPLDSVLLQRDGGNNPSGNASNHVVTNARDPETGGYFTGTMALSFTRNPHGVTFVVRANECAQPQVAAFAPTGATLEVGRTDEQLYGGVEQRECTRFRQERITVVSEDGISRITLSGQLMLVDDMRLTP